jgi:serine/threonine-protein kinase
MTEGRRLGQYELLEIIGQGETLTLYRARDTQRSKSVILKLVHAHLQDDADVTARFRSRAQRLLRLEHPRILPVLDASFEKDALYLVTDVPDGESLERRRYSKLEIDDALSIVSQIAEALDYAHEQGVCHLDLRPANIYLKDKSAVLTDFCILEAVGATPAYAAPEQLDENSVEDPDCRSDAYALGVVVYEMLTGRPPFEGAAADIAAAHLTQRPLAPRVHNPDLLPAVDAILLKALAKQPQSRYRSAGELATILHEAVQMAQTRRMADDEMFDVQARIGNETTNKAAAEYGDGRLPAWAWIGLGILLVVVIAIIILLATG